MLKERNYDFRQRHWQYHRPGMRQSGRAVHDHELEITSEWQIGCSPDAPRILHDAARDFQDYLRTSMETTVKLTTEEGNKTLWIKLDPALKKGFLLTGTADHLTVTLSTPELAYPSVVYLEDWMNLEGAPVFPCGETRRIPLYTCREIHSGCGIDEYPDAELAATVHAGYNEIMLMMKGLDQSAAGKVDVNDLIDRAERFGITVTIFNYVQTFVHPDEPGAQEIFDRTYGEIFRRYPKLRGIRLGGESLEFPSRDPHTTGKKYKDSFSEGIPDPRPSPGWYPCSDYPAYLACIERAVHKVRPDAKVIFSTYNWGWAPLELREKFLADFPKGMTLSVCYEIFAKRTLEGLRTPVMDYTISQTEPGYYFRSECECTAKHGITVSGNVNTAGIGWDFGTVPWVPTPQRWLERDRILRDAAEKMTVTEHYATHHYGWWNSPAAELGKWSSWADFEPDYHELLRKIAIRDHGRESADHVLAAWECWSRAMDHYVASNEDQYGPWRVGPAYPFIFQPNITRTMMNKEIRFPTAPHAHFGSAIIKTLYQPYENANQAPAFLRYPAELRSLERMLAEWEKGLSEAEKAAVTPEGERLAALGRFIRNSIITTIHIKQWWLLNMKLQLSDSEESALETLAEIEKLARKEIANAEDTIPAVECDSRLGWEPSMEYVCDRHHLEWKIRQVNSALAEIEIYRNIIRNAKTEQEQTCNI